MAWENGELITATKLNSMENGIGENNMSYEKHTWETGELITADKLNHMEEGIEGGSAELHPELTLNVSPHNSDANVLNGVICLPDNAAVLENGCLVALDNTIGYTTTIQDENTGTGTVILSANREDGQTYSAIAVEFLVSSTDEGKRITTVTASNLVNCSYDEGYITIADITKEASIDLDIVFDGGVG